ncbi:response regulator receiver protein [Nostoc commune NIES-4072]|uniref:Response regulator receiver protein n=1 Tax=Nostoc commune NIES-4072 TaxID=2005467 RepID=A0A2R5FRL5_NOSCO|nr:response regulator receiver protein [Nostoc commune HK-02]GBG21407.1 response regulator receiver protein [Nostoc commune NIES-4072]
MKIAQAKVLQNTSSNVIYTEIYYPPIAKNFVYSGGILNDNRQSRYLHLKFLLEQTVVASNKILVIDDTTVVRVKVREMLPPGNFEVLEAKDGLEGLNFILQEKLSLIMLDFLLPKMSGWEVFQKVQADPELRKIPLVIMSGRKEEVTEKITEPFEYFEFLGKPFDQKQLINAIKLAMTKAKQPRPELVPVGAATVKNGTVTTSGVTTATVAAPSVANTAMPTAVSNATPSAVTASATPTAGGASDAEISALNEKIVKMQAEIDGLKKQLTQVVTFIKQKIK